MNSLHVLVADKLEQADPATREASPRIPLANIDRRLANGHTVLHRPKQWQQILRRAQQSPGGITELLGLLRDQGEGSTHSHSHDSFPDVLTTLDRRPLLLQCAYAH